MKVTLIHPGERANLMPPMGVLYVAATLRKNGYEAQVLDPTLEEREFQEVVNFMPDIVGVSVGTTNLGRAKEVLDIIRTKLSKKVAYCAGGAYATACPRKTLEKLGLDFVVVGEGEQKMLAACGALEKQLSLSGVEGIIYRDGDQVVENEPGQLIGDLDSVPFPARDLLDFSWYLLPPGLIRGFSLNGTTTVLTSRGCPGRCIFCSSHLIFGRKVRRRSVANVMAEIEYLINEYKIEGIWFLDDTFTLNLNWIKDFCQEIIKRKIKIVWGCQARVDTVTEELLKIMKDAGCVQLDFGMESGSDKVLKILKKDTTSDKIVKALDMTKKVGLRRMVTVMVGNPGETTEDIEKTYQVLKKTAPDFLGVGFITPYPGTEIYDLAVANKWVDPDIFYSEKWLKNQVAYPSMCINFSGEELIKIKARLQNEASGFKIYLGVLRNTKLLAELIFLILRHPLRILKRMKIVLKTRNIDDIAQIIIIEYRQEKARNKKILA